MVAIALSKAQCHFCKKKMMWGGFTSIVLDLKKFNIRKDNWSLGGLCLNADKPICKTCSEKTRKMFL